MGDQGWIFQFRLGWAIIYACVDSVVKTGLAIHIDQANQKAVLSIASMCMWSMLLVGGWEHASLGKFLKLHTLRLKLRAYSNIYIYKEFCVGGSKVKMVI